MICSGDASGLGADTGRKLVEQCASDKCEYVCDTEHYFEAGTCLPCTCQGSMPESAVKCPSDETGLTANTGWLGVGTKLNECTNQRKCEYYDTKGKVKSWQEVK